MRLAWCLWLLAACDSSMNAPDVVGPYTGEVHRYYVDDVTLPLTSTATRTLADDLNGDHTADNELGATIAAISSQGHDITAYTRDILAASATHATLEIHADDLMNDATVGVTLRGTDDDPMAVEVGGRLDHGVFVSNRTATAADLGSTTLHLPVLIDADPSVFVLQDMEVDLTPDGHGGYDGVVRGLVGEDIIAIAAKGLLQMIDNNPADHAELISYLVPAHSGPVTLDELETSSFLTALLQPDISRGGKKYVSFGFGVHFAAMPPTTVTDTCHDRVLDGAETAVDCGDRCSPCAGGETCAMASDCQSHSCNGTCSEISCADGARDGLESDVDCGGWQCDACASGRACEIDADCASGHCLATHACE